MSEMPIFVQMSIPATRPELPESLAVGDSVLVSERSLYRHAPVKREPTNGTIIKKGRVWITVRLDMKYPHEVRFRMDTQRDDSQTNYGRYFRTEEQHIWEEVRYAAGTYLRAQGIIVGPESVWRHREVLLARVIWHANHPTKQEVQDAS